MTASSSHSVTKRCWPKRVCRCNARGRRRATACKRCVTIHSARSRSSTGYWTAPIAVFAIESANDMAVFAQIRLVQRSQHFVGVAVAHLEHRTKFLVEQGRRGIAAQFIQCHVHAYTTGEGHFAHRREQATVGAVVVGEE